ncbi:hypothetical protein NYR55_05170 [Sphingomonas sp. BGYR3]|uniref:hypothetical protein n=1 Tax=Sphingomonas sp. BGYR3 TaxID=2975483 RepID=UPI0021A79921|nr:hypothetical protein [Sphingomonas sp. BGYR3]MDG5488011.1 hypothetical protein [Sphingomonas sp. BGYR3]
MATGPAGAVPIRVSFRCNCARHGRVASPVPSALVASGRSWRQRPCLAGTIDRAIGREKLVKKWRREWKFALIEKDNPDWDDLWDQWFATGMSKR